MYNNKCQRCGYKSYDVGFFDFHHIVPEEKEHNIGRLINGASWDLIMEEASKCMMLCPNCHRLEHMEMRLAAEIEELDSVSRSSD
jgi:C4-type Zn-finger protein